MTLIVQPDGWLSFVLKKPSPHFNERPVASAVSLLVIHNISVPPGQFEGDAIIELFQNTLDCRLPIYQHLQGLRVSAHVVIRRSGLIIQCVGFDERAWHAGVSSFEGVTDCNDYSIGIELEGTDTQAFTDAQYASLQAVTRAIQARYPLITLARITGHEHIAPGRKTDPGPHFDWCRYRAGLSGQCA